MKTALVRTELGDTIAGWRTVRELSLPRDAHFTAYSAVTEAVSTSTSRGSEHWHEFDSAAPAQLDQARILIAAGQSDCESLARDAAIREAIDCDFVCPILDLVRDGDRLVGIHSVTATATYSDLVANQAVLSAGACVTATYPLVETIGRAHAAGWAHGHLSLQHIILDARSKPWVEGWGSATELGVLAALKRDLAIGDDLRALGRICDSILALCDSDVPSELTMIINALRQGTASGAVLARLQEALNYWATPAAVPLPTSSKVRPSSADGQAGTIAVALTREQPAEPLVATPKKRTSSALTEQGRLLAERTFRMASQVRPLIWLAVSGVGAFIGMSGILL